MTLLFLICRFVSDPNDTNIHPNDPNSDHSDIFARLDSFIVSKNNIWRGRYIRVALFIFTKAIDVSIDGFEVNKTQNNQFIQTTC